MSLEIHECRMCNNRYEELPSDVTNQDMNKYIHYLGICDKECWDNITDNHKDLIMFRASVLGDDRKRNRIPVLSKHKKKK
tara:strand:- start:10054 stop:10293 length:240 start_codon:yes stop_codon:yes gene_type:complete